MRIQHRELIILIIILCCFISLYCAKEEFCGLKDNECKNSSPTTRYLLYDVNPPEGFNLRRDVYMRLSVLAHNLKNSPNPELNSFKLVLPPWHDLYHWRLSEYENVHIPWSHFFDLKSLRKFAPVIEMYEYFNEIGENFKKTDIDEVYILQHFEDMFETGNFEDRMSVEKCQQKINVNFFDYSNMTSSNIKCLSFHGPASQLKNVLLKSKSRSIFIDHAEIVLHDNYGDKLYWQARRSMRFKKELRNVADKFRELYLNSTNEKDNTIIPEDWTKEILHRNALGGPYLCVHLRRRDFLWGRPQEVPSIKNAANQIKTILKLRNLSVVFVATDAAETEFEELQRDLADYKVIRFKPTENISRKYKEGGVAIIEQIICSHAQFFTGTHESTFSFRIQEEREILGFPAGTTFNRLCGDNVVTCDKPSIWKIIH